jgi:uncharacterized membrane-anchored protein
MFLVPIAALIAFGAPLAGDTADSQAVADSFAAYESRLPWQSGHITIQGGFATLDLPEGYRFLGPKPAQDVLEHYGNPKREDVLGMILPPGATVRDNPYVVVISYAEDGYVKDDEAATTDYAKLLKEMQQSAVDADADRTKAGYPTIRLVGWAEAPHYDKDTHQLYWAKRLQFSNRQHETLNYCIRALGRRGVMELNMVASMSALDTVRAGTPAILSAIAFTPGNRYADFDAKHGDKVAEYGIIALIAGGVAAKAGLFKGLIALLIAAKKLILVAIAGIAAWWQRTFGKNRNRPVKST